MASCTHTHTHAHSTIHLFPLDWNFPVLLTLSVVDDVQMAVYGYHDVGLGRAEG